MIAPPDRLALTDEQRAAVEWGDGPLMVLAGAGTGKTTVIVERVAHLLAHDSSLAPENVLVLTYNVKAAAELAERFERRLGMDMASRLWVSNFHAFGHRVAQDHRAQLGLPAAVDVLDPVGQRLLLRAIRPALDLLYYGGWDPNGSLGHFADLISRAKDELISVADYRTLADERRATFEQTAWPDAYEACIASLRDGTLGPARAVRPYLDHPQAGYQLEREARKQARRVLRGDGYAGYDAELPPELRPQHDRLWPTFIRDAAALDVRRLDEEAQVYAAYQAELQRRGALDFGEQIQLVIRLFEQRPDVLRRYQRQFRHILVDEFQDANVAQILLLELLGRAPDRPDNVVVVGDDDQSIYRFRGASYAAFERFRIRFGRQPGWDAEQPPQTVAELPLLRNRRSTGRILSAAGRLIASNARRLKADLALEAARGPGAPVDIIVAADEADEADAIAEWIRAALATLRPDVFAPDGSSRPRRWSDVAVLYRKHKHRELIADRLRRAGIPYQAVGGVGLFAHPEVRDLEAVLRVAADPHDSAAFTRVLSAPPWRLDAAQIMRLSRAASFDGSPMFDAAARIRRRGALEVDVVETSASETSASDPIAPLTAEGPAPMDPLTGQPTLWGVAQLPQATRAARPKERRRTEQLEDALRIKLDRVMACFDDLSPRANRDGPFTILEAYLTRTHLLFDLVAAGTGEAQRAILVIARFMRFVSDRQRERPRASLRDFIAYLDLYQEVGGDLDLDGTAQVQVDGVQLMTVYQAKGLEYEVVVVPRLVNGEFPMERTERLLIPVELLQQEPPAGFDVDEERRLLYVAMTRARQRLLLTTIDVPGGGVRPSRFAGEISPQLALAETSTSVDASSVDASSVDASSVDASGRAPAAPDDVAVTRRAALDDEVDPEGILAQLDRAPEATDTPLPAARLMPIPTVFERRFSLRRRAVELIGALEALGAGDEGGRRALIDELIAVASAAAGAADEARLHGVDPVTLDVLTRHAPAGEELLRLAPLPWAFSHSQFRTYGECPSRYAFEQLYRIPIEGTRSYFEYGTLMHGAFESFVGARREALAAGLPEPGSQTLEAAFRAAWTAADFPDKVGADHYAGKAEQELRAFYEREVAGLSHAVALEIAFTMELSPRDGSAPVRLRGVIDRIDRHPDGTIEVIDYKTGHARTQGAVDADEQLTTYALALREGAVRDPATGERLATPRRLTLYFTSAGLALSTTRSPEQLDAHRDALVATAKRIRSGDFAATPTARLCARCDYRRICPSRFRGTAVT